jgi:polyferredoxin
MGPRRILLAYLVLFSIAVPWYWNFLPIADDVLVLGMPAWAFGATIGSLSISLFSAWILSRRWPCEEVEEQQSDNQRTDAEDPVS